MKQRLGVQFHMVKYNPFQPKLHQKQQAQLLPQPRQPGQHPQPQQQAKHMVSCVIVNQCTTYRVKLEVCYRAAPRNLSLNAMSLQQTT